jgi:hypothetical protein
VPRGMTAPRRPIEAGEPHAVLASAGDGKGEDRYYPLISAPRTQARLGRCSSAGPRPAAAGAAIRACARPLGRRAARRRAIARLAGRWWWHAGNDADRSAIGDPAGHGVPKGYC